MTTWHDTDDYSRSYAETDDPRILLVIERQTDTSSTAPDGDAYAPAYWLDYPREPQRAGYTYNDDESDRLVSIYQNVHAYAVKAQYDYAHPNRKRAMRDYDTFTRRYMRIFHATTYEVLWGQGDAIILLNTPGFRHHVGLENPDGTRALNGAGDPIDDSIALSLDGDRDTWRAYLDGDVYGVGWAVSDARTTTEAPVDLDDPEQAWDVNIEVWGFYGEDYAKSECADYADPCLPNLTPLLPDTDPGAHAA